MKCHPQDGAREPQCPPGGATTPIAIGRSTVYTMPIGY